MQPNLMNDFCRDISYRVSCDNGRLLLTASLSDRYHDIRVEVTVGEQSLMIEGVSAHFRACPTRTCHCAADRLQRLVGITIGKGLNRHIVDALGGEQGCGNLRNLLLGLLPLALNVKAAAGYHDEQAMLNNISQQLKGTCAGYP